MAFKLFIIAAVVVAARAGFLGAPLARTVAVDTDYDPNPHYSYSYDVQDALTGDSKGQSETRDGDVVSGSYNLLEADGTRRIVDYTADPVNGFNAVVHKEGVAKAVVAKVAAPVAVAHPVAYTSHPVAYAAHHPVAYTSHPVAYAAHHPVAYTAHHPVAYTAHPVAYAAHHPIAYAAPVHHKIIV